MQDNLSDRDAFIQAAVGHGPLDTANAILAAHPEVAVCGIHTAALLGEAAAVRRFLAEDPSLASAQLPPLGWDALTHLAFSKYLRLDRSRTSAFVDAATALLDAGASAATGYFDASHQPSPAFESAIYGAAGVAHHPELTRLLVERGADPNDGETPYHAPETYDNAALTALLDSGKLNADSLATLLLRKADWHDFHGLRLLLDRGADPNRPTQWGFTALQQALRRDNAIENIDLLLDRGAEGRFALSLAARRGRRDVLESLEQRGIALQFDSGIERLLGACARNDGAEAHRLAAAEPGVLAELLAEGGAHLARFAGTANTAGVGLLLDLGVPIAALYEEGDGYYGIAGNSTALHVAAWRGWHETVRFLIARGAPVDSLDGAGRTPLALAVRACVDSHWTHRRSPDSVAALLAAGAPPSGVAGIPCGYAEVDRLFS